MPFVSTPGRTGLARLARRIETLGHTVAEVETSCGAPALLVDRGAGRAAVLPAELASAPAGLLEQTVAVVRGLAPSRPSTLLAWGPIPERATRQRLRLAGFELALYEPLDAATLHFQVNRALAPRQALPRRAIRAPLAGEVALHFRLQRRAARVYTLSSQGAFILTPRPLRPGRRVTVEVPAGLLTPRARGRVVMVNPPDARTQPELPAGMAVAFQDLDGPSAAVIDRLVGERLAELSI